MPAPQTIVQLGDIDYVLVPQKHTAIKRGVTRIFEALGEEDLAGGAGLMAVLERKAWEAIKVFIPSLMSRDDFMGTGEDGDQHVPTIPEIRDAIKKGMEVNGLTGFTGLRELLPTELIKAQIGVAIAEAVGQSARKNSASLPVLSGDSPSTPSTPSGPTPSPTDPSDSPSLDSSFSSPLAVIDGGASSETSRPQ